MSEQPQPGAVPQWDLADRMRKSLRYAGITPGEMAAYLGVRGNTVSTWINGHVEPSIQTLRLWALRCGVPYQWLSEGRVSPCKRPLPPTRRGARHHEPPVRMAA